LLLDFTNDPFVDRDSPRQYDNFTFPFPRDPGKDGTPIISYAGRDAPSPWRAKQAVFLAVKKFASLQMPPYRRKPNGYLSLSLVIRDNLE